MLRWFYIVFHGIRPVPADNLFQWRSGSDVCTMGSTMYSRSSAVDLLERLRLQDGEVGTSTGKFACGRLRVWRGCDKVVSVDIIEARETWLIDTILSILFSDMVTICN